MKARFEHSWMGVPFVAGGKTIGVYSLSRAEPGAFGESHLRLAQALSAPAAVAIENAMLFRQLTAERERLHTLSRKLVDLQENERRAIARELHDETGQVLTSLKIGLRLLEQTSEDPVISREVGRSAANRRRGAGGPSSPCANLRPPDLEHVGLVAALGQLAADLSYSSGVKIEVETVGCEGRGCRGAPKRTCSASPGGADERAPARRSGRDQRLARSTRGRLRLVVEDDGRGFQADSMNHADRLGLVGMRERAEILGGDPRGRERARIRNDRRGGGSRCQARIVLADDHGVLRAGLAALLNAEPGFDVVERPRRGGGCAGRVERRPDLFCWMWKASRNV